VELFDARWKQRSDAAKLAAEQAVLLLRPQRAPGGAAALPDRSERFQDIMAAARNLAQVGAESAAGYSATMGGLAQLLSSLRLAGASRGWRRCACALRSRADSRSSCRAACRRCSRSALRRHRLLRRRRRRRRRCRRRR